MRKGPLISKKIAISREAGFSLFEVMIVAALMGAVVIGFSSSFSKSMQAKKSIEAKLTYEDISISLQSILNDVLRNPPGSPACITAQKISEKGLSSGLFASATPGVDTLDAPMTKQIEQPQNDFVEEAVKRCKSPRAITSPSSATDNVLYFCNRFETSAGASFGAEQSFVEFRVEFINAHTDQPVSCDTYRTSNQVGARIFANLYWVNSNDKSETFSKLSRYYYVGK